MRTPINYDITATQRSYIGEVDKVVETKQTYTGLVEAEVMPIINLLSAGEYSVTITVSPNYKEEE